MKNSTLHFSRVTRHFLWFSLVSLALSFVSVAAQASTEERPMSLSEQQHDLRVQHARELLGKFYKHSAARSGESVRKINSKIYAWTKERLPKAYRGRYKVVAQTIIDESYKYELDPVFVMSIIQSESSFNPTTIGSLDEIGLMQLRPATAQWISEKYGLKKATKKMLKDPVQNIRYGTAYLDYLRSRFDSHARLYLSAYNMGSRSVDEALEHHIWPKDYARQVMKHYLEFYTTLRDEKEAAASASSETHAAYSPMRLDQRRSEI